MSETVTGVDLVVESLRVAAGEPPTTLRLHRRIVRHPAFVAGGVTTAHLERLVREEGA